MNSLQPEIVAKGKEIFDRMAGQKPAFFSQKNLAGLLMKWSMENPELKGRLFQFVDVLPALESAAEIAQHARDYLAENSSGLPRMVRWGIQQAGSIPWLASLAARQSVAQIARSFVLAAGAREAAPILRAMRDQPLAFTIDILGETALSESEAEQYQARYLGLLQTLARESAAWPAVRRLDFDDRGPIPRVNVSIKISALNSQIHPEDPEGALAKLAVRLRPILDCARAAQAFINFDMEHHALKDLTLALFQRLFSRPEFRDYPHAGIAIQAYLKETEADLEKLLAWVKARGAPVTIRLIKGAYWDYETILAQQRGWPVPVFAHKSETDANYERLSQRVLRERDWFRPAFGAHSVRSIAAILVHAEKMGVPIEGFEFQMLYGMAEPIKAALIQMGCRVRDYCPIGDVLPGMSYLVRRLLENTSNESFLRATFAENVSAEELLQDPAEIIPLSQPPPPPPRFSNEPHSDFTREENRQRMQQALARGPEHFGKFYPARIQNEPIASADEILSRNPARPSQIVARVGKASVADANRAVVNARIAFLKWRRAPAAQRARLLERLAQRIARDRFDLAVLEVFETGKTWAESDADVAEAIDFCRYYAARMISLAEDQWPVPGESNVYEQVPRGLCAVIAPWNFPLAILTGMTAAALVAGNCVLIKPSELSSAVAARLMELLIESGAPPGVAQFLPGAGEEIGARLVEHPEIEVIAFTGSREVGLKIWEAAGRARAGQANLKKVICEMGGKNAAIVDSDADLDEAIPAIVRSAFGYQGQKCSALSRLIVVEPIYARLLSRLTEATRSLKIGFPEDPSVDLGPLIDAHAFQRVSEYIELGKKEAALAFQGSAPAGDGYFVAPTLFKDVPPQARIAQEEIFGPVLSILPARDMDHALEIAHDSIYALTGGLFSRNPRHIEQVKREWAVGNLYINRGITGALVGRQPFGGFRMSGGGTKAGGPEYLLHFLFPRVITENLMRRGFAPEAERRPLPGGE